MEENEIMAMLIYLIPAGILGGLALFVTRRKKKN
jgi:LPXTG-motif cell wall-anchored protein